MLNTYTWPRYDSPPAPEIGAASPRRVPLVVVGAGPVGLCAAIDAAQRGLPVLLLEQEHTVSLGSRGVCYAKRTLEIFDRLGLGQRVVDQGVTWNVGRTFHGDEEVFSFHLQPEPGHQRPGMVNLQQYHLEQALVERAQQLPGLDLRWGQQVVQVQPRADGAWLQVHSEAGDYTLHADWLVVADGARSPIRRALGLDIDGQVFQDRFLIADVVLDAEPYPLAQTERRFWFAPSFFEGESALLHRQADHVWRVDFQLGWQVDPEVEKQPDRVAARVRQMLDLQGWGHIGFALEWVSVYTFQCRRMQQFRHGRLLFVGDAAHQVSPFGARGANSGIQDVDNLVWKLAAVLQGRAPEALLDSYHQERAAAADENIQNSTRSTTFMTPKSRVARTLRQAVLSLAAQVPAGRALVNSGRLSVPTLLLDSPLNTPADHPVQGWMLPGVPADDAPLADGGWLLQRLHGLSAGFTLLLFGASESVEPPAADTLIALAQGPSSVQTLALPCEGLLAQRYDARPGTAVLLRPDQHVVARWQRLDPAAVQAAVQRALGHALPTEAPPCIAST